MRKIIVVSTILIIITLSVLLAKFLMSMKPEQKKRPPIEAQIHVKAEKVRYKAIQSEVYATGRVNSARQVDLSSEVQGKILETSIPLKKGQNFKKGDLLVSIYKQDVLYLLHSRKSRFLNLLANTLPDLKIDFSEGYTRWESFFQEISIEKSLPELPEITLAQEKIFVASKNLLSEYYGIKSDEIRIQKYNIYAPFTGSYTDVFLEAGSVANPGGKIAKMIRTDLLEVEVPVEVTNAKWIKTGDEAKITDEKENKSWKGKVIRKSNYVNESTQSINVFVAVNPRNDESLYQGEYLKVIFPGQLFENVMEMPRNALLEKNQVYLVEDSKLIKANIQLLKLNQKTLLFKGIEEGAELVVEPLLNIAENTKVSILR